MIGALSVGRLRIAPRGSLVFSLVVIGLATIAMSVPGSFPLWAIARWVAGVFSAVVLVVIGSRFVGYLARVEAQGAQGWIFAGVGGGTAMVGAATLAMMWIGSTSEQAWLGFGVLTLLAAGVVGWWGPRLLEEASSGAREAVTRVPIAWRLVLPYGAMGAGYIIPATYLPIMAQQVVSSPLVFGWTWPIFGFSAAVSTLIGARLNAICSNKRIWTVSQLVMAAGLLAPAIWNSLAMVLVAGVCVGGTFMVITMAGIKEALGVGGGDAPRHVAGMTAAFALGQIIGPVVAGWAHAVTGGFTYPLILGSAVLAITLIPMALTKD